MRLKRKAIWDKQGEALSFRATQKQSAKISSVRGIFGQILWEYRKKSQHLLKMMITLDLILLHNDSRELQILQALQEVTTLETSYAIYSLESPTYEFFQKKFLFFVVHI